LWLLRHGKTNYFQSVCTPQDQQELVNAGFLDLTKSSKAGLIHNTNSLAKEIDPNEKLLIYPSSSIRAIGTARVAEQQLQKCGISIENNTLSKTSQIAQLRCYDSQTVVQSATNTYPSVYQEALTNSYQDDGYGWFNGPDTIEDRYHSSARSLAFLRKLQRISCFKEKNWPKQIILVAHSETLNPPLEMFLNSNLPLESKPNPGKSLQGVERGEYYKITLVQNIQNLRKYYIVQFRDTQKRIPESELNLDKNHLYTNRNEVYEISDV
jgi:broad specificity phosphatase PhoE